MAGERHFEVKAAVGDHFAWLRTRLAAERTFMAWVRTCISLVGFGFTIVQFFQKLGTMAGVAPATLPQAPRYLGLSLIGSGVIGMTIAIAQYIGFLRYLWRDDFKPIGGIHDTPSASPVIVVAVILWAVGVFAFFAVLLRMT
jgi:putative membrane protein